jgi:hypothetical protein
VLPVVDVLCVHNAHPIPALDGNTGYHWYGDIVAHSSAKIFLGTILKPMVAGTAFGIHLGERTQSLNRFRLVRRIDVKNDFCLFIFVMKNAF